MNARAAIAITLLAAALGGCGRDIGHEAACDARITTAPALLAQPAFSTLTHRTHTDFHVGSNIAYDLWADARFDYRSGLEFGLRPPAKADTLLERCVHYAGLRLMLPADAAQRAMLEAYLREVAPRARIDSAAVTTRVMEAFQSGDKYRSRLVQDGIEVQAGKLAHPNRGEFFMVTIGLRD